MSSTSPGPLGYRRWGPLPLVIDTSAYARVHRSTVIDDWEAAANADQLRLCPASQLEILYSARDHTTLAELLEELSAYRQAPLTPTVVQAAAGAMLKLVQRSAGAHRIPIVDYLVAASAQEIGGAVIHYDHDYDRLAEVMAFESVWLAPPGSLDKTPTTDWA